MENEYDPNDGKLDMKLIMQIKKLYYCCFFSFLLFSEQSSSGYRRSTEATSTSSKQSEAPSDEARQWWPEEINSRTTKSSSESESGCGNLCCTEMNHGSISFWLSCCAIASLSLSVYSFENINNNFFSFVRVLCPLSFIFLLVLLFVIRTNKANQMIAFSYSSSPSLSRSLWQTMTKRGGRERTEDRCTSGQTYSASSIFFPGSACQLRWDTKDDLNSFFRSLNETTGQCSPFSLGFCACSLAMRCRRTLRQTHWTILAVRCSIIFSILLIQPLNTRHPTTVSGSNNSVVFSKTMKVFDWSMPNDERSIRMMIRGTSSTGQVRWSTRKICRRSIPTWVSSLSHWWVLIHLR